MTTSVGGQNLDVIQRWIADTEQFKKNIADAAKVIQQQQREEKQLGIVRAELTRKTEQLAQANTSMATSLAKDAGSKAWDFAKGNIYAAAIGGLKDLAVEALKNASAYDRMSSSFKGSIEKLREATGNEVTDLQLMTAVQSAHTLGLQLSEEKYAALSGAVKTLTEQFGQDFGPTMQMVNEALASGTTRTLKQIGVVVDAEEAYGKFADKIGKSITKLTEHEKLLAKQEESLVQMEKAAERSAVSVDTLGNKWERLTTTISNATSKLIDWIANAARLEGGDALSSMIPGYRTIRTVGQIEAGEKSSAAIRAEQEARLASSGLLSGEGERFAAPGSALGGGGGESWTSATESALAEGRKGGLKWMTEPGGKKKKGRRGPTLAEEIADFAWQMERAAAHRAADEINRAIEDQRARARTSEFEQSTRESDIWNREEMWMSQAVRRDAQERTERYNRERTVGGMREGKYGFMIDDKLAAWAMTSNDAVTKLHESIAGLDEQLTGFASGSLQQAYDGLLGLADAAIQGNFVEAALSFIKSTAFSLSSQLFTMGVAAQIESTALAATPWTAPLAAMAQAKAGIFFGGAALFAGGGLIASGIASAVGGGESGSAATAMRPAMPNPYQPNHKEKEDKTVTVINNVYIGGEDDLGAIPYMQRKIKTAVQSN